MAEPVVYIVDDDAAVRQAVGLLLRSVGLMSLPFDSGQAFLDHWHEDQPGCLLLDIRMPGMSGLELQTRLAANPLAPPVLFITGHGDVSMAVRAMREGAVRPCLSACSERSTSMPRIVSWSGAGVQHRPGSPR
jgi:two-component system, LuxR family, response regulator FixJ